MKGMIIKPWFLEGFGRVIIHHGSSHQTFMELYSNHIGGDDISEIVQLVSAAPELYEALRVVFEEENCDGFADETQHIIRKALAKARGES